MVAGVSLDQEPLLHQLAAWWMILVGVCVIIVEVGFGARAPYGRHASLPAARYYGPVIHPKVAWAFQESWSVLVPLAMLTAADARCLAAPRNLLLLSMFLGHYCYRSLIFPWRMRGGAPMPIGLCLCASAFCAWNGYVQGRAWTALSVRSTDTPLDVLCVALGFGVWAAGLYINLQADHILRTLRKPGETGYKVPYGGAFKYVSGANYFGEIVEWCGYAICSGGTLPAVAFAFFTFANTAPRAHHHHLWYRAKFDDYPAERRAVIPFLW